MLNQTIEGENVFEGCFGKGAGGHADRPRFPIGAERNGAEVSTMASRDQIAELGIFENQALKTWWNLDDVLEPTSRSPGRATCKTARSRELQDALRSRAVF